MLLIIYKSKLNSIYVTELKWINNISVCIRRLKKSNFFYLEFLQQRGWSSLVISEHEAFFKLNWQ